MGNEVLTYIKIIFLLGFTLHNIEEALWLPGWSKHAEKFHKAVDRDQFIFAVIIVTILGYIITGIDILTGSPGSFFNYLYLGFVGMMGLNAILPHLLATMVLKKYAPGLITALCLNLPFSLVIILGYLQRDINVLYLILSIVLVSAVVLISLKYLFKLGELLIDFVPDNPPPDQTINRKASSLE